MMQPCYLILNFYKLNLKCINHFIMKNIFLFNAMLLNSYSCSIFSQISSLEGGKQTDTHVCITHMCVCVYICMCVYIYIYKIYFLFIGGPRILPSTLMKHSSNLVLINKHLQPKSKRKGSSRVFLSSLESQQHSKFHGGKMRGKAQNYLSFI